MILTYPIFDKKIEAIQEQLKDMVVAHELVERPEIDTPSLVFGEEKITGILAIQQYLDQLFLEIQIGYHCSVDPTLKEDFEKDQ